MKTTKYSHHTFARRTLIAGAVLAAFAFNLASTEALAQSAPQAAPAAAPAGDPPSRVARLDYMAGDVTTEPAGATDWSYAQLNRPLTTGDQLWNDSNARSEMHIGSTAVRMGPQTSLDVLNLDDASAQLKVAQGTLSTRVRSLPAGTAYEIDTPNLALGLNGPGDYRVDVAPDGSATTVTVRSGSVTVYGENGQMPMQAGQQIRFTGTALQQVASVAAPPPDAFDQWALARDAAEDRSVSARYVSRDIPGYQDLDANGTWRESPQYGEVWVPNAEPTGWAPYHDGHWVWQAPWGWTWVDDAPWGFAPYHYGRWAQVDDSWAWVPGPIVESAPPVYAPALVAFVGGGGGGDDWGVNLAIGGAAAAGVAWFALGPGEAWHPGWGGWSPHYYQRVNQTVVVNNYRQNVNITNINVHNTYINYHVPGAVTAVPATAFVHGQPTARFAQHVDPRQWQNARIQPGTPGIAPVQGSFAANMRRADYRPPATLNQRQVVATRAPITPPAFHDNLAQRFAHGGGTVPGAGAPVVRVSAPAHASFAPFSTASHGGWPQQNVRVVPPHSPEISASRPNGAPGSAQQNAPRGPNEANAPAAQHGQPNFAPGASAMAANVHGPAGAQADAAHGVPHPPQFAGHPQAGQPQAAMNGRAPAAGAQGEAHQPEWTQAHTPMALRGQPGANEAGRQPSPAMQQPHEAAAQRVPERGNEPVPQPQAAQPQHGFEAQARPEQRQEQRPEQRPEQQPQAHADVHPQQAQAQPPREEVHPQPQAQPRAEPRPQQQTREEFHPQPQAQPRAEPRPQPQPQQRAEFHPQPQPQPRAEPHPQPQPQPHPQEHAAGNHDEHHHG
ncbi:hypothetical protein F4827_000159 [Paraburkholderia bannensis]|uniref:FecR protein domain-containing protein n=1 Tax=Paraburkholderia bannensis TaxID=765414 RepID=A0A7W9TTX3_9BURK|nr:MULTISPECIES: DUF6600 domain-containing protein [Paraburkholderia]MBB3255634.1 hypothetical protein [Paraburkholderia sp. WP4_3_2]MBB6100355.1 hypothetical protein [Paraburkholderia bannensis]